MLPRNQAALHQEAVAVTCLFFGAVLLLIQPAFAGPAAALSQLPAENWCGHSGLLAGRISSCFHRSTSLPGGFLGSLLEGKTGSILLLLFSLMATVRFSPLRGRGEQTAASSS